MLATGGLAQRPDLPGAALAGSFVLRSREDAAQLLDAARGRKRAVIIGDSFIGLEAASALRQLGLQVHVISRHDVPMAHVLGEPIGRALHEQQGVVFHSPADLKALEGETHVQTVLLGNGERIATDIVLFGTGVHPATACAQGLLAADDHSLKNGHTSGRPARPCLATRSARSRACCRTATDATRPFSCGPLHHGPISLKS